MVGSKETGRRRLLACLTLVWALASGSSPILAAAQTVVVYRYQILEGGLGLALRPREAACPGSPGSFERLSRALSLLAADRRTVDGRLSWEADRASFFETRRLALTLELSGPSGGGLGPHLPAGCAVLGRLLPLVATAQGAGAERVYVKILGLPEPARTWTLASLLGRLGTRAQAFSLRLRDEGGLPRRRPAWLLLHDVPATRTIWIEGPVERIKVKLAYGRVTYLRAFLRGSKRN